MINGQEVSNMTQKEVVDLIRAARDVKTNAQLIITVQQKGMQRQ